MTSEMSSVSKQKKARILELKEKWATHEAAIMKIQSVLAWADNPSKGLFVFICITLHFILRWSYYFFTELGLITLLSLIGVFYFVGKWISTNITIPWTTLLVPTYFPLFQMQSC